IRDDLVTGVQTCALPIWLRRRGETVIRLERAREAAAADEADLHRTREEAEQVARAHVDLVLERRPALGALPEPSFHAHLGDRPEIGRASWRERAQISVVG